MPKSRFGFFMIQVGHVVHMHERCAHDNFSAAGISRGMPPLICYLIAHPGSIQREIAANLHLNPASVTSVLTTMEEAGYVIRKPMGGDKRALQVWLTEKGQEKFDVIAKTHKVLEDVCFDGFTAEEKKQFLAYTGKMFNNLLSYEQLQRGTGK